jgi:hypothetical protein
MSIETFSIIPGFDLNKKPDKRVQQHEPRKRFVKAGKNATHRYTVQMRHIKSALRLTTAQLVAELNAYEKVHQSKNFHRRGADKNRPDPNAPAWLPMTNELMSSYLQGWVVQEAYMELMTKRLKYLYEFKKAQDELAPKTDIRTIMNSWYKTLGIDPEDTSTSPTRMLGRLIAPYYKRPVLAGVAGTFKLDKVMDGWQHVHITDSEGEKHEFMLTAGEPILVKDGQKVKVSDVLQYSVLMQTQKKEGKAVLTHEPSINHTTFFRWYSNNRMPRSIKTIELVQAAVDEAAKNLGNNP